MHLLTRISGGEFVEEKLVNAFIMLDEQMRATERLCAFNDSVLTGSSSWSEEGYQTLKKFGTLIDDCTKDADRNGIQIEIPLALCKLLLRVRRVKLWDDLGLEAQDLDRLYSYAGSYDADAEAQSFLRARHI